MNFWRFLIENRYELLTLFRQHLVLVVVSTLIAVSLGVPTGILLTRNSRLRGPVLGLANIMQTIPSLALFGFLIPMPLIGGIGARIAIVALVVYALLPIIRNTVMGILGVDQNVREAAVAMGMTNGQILWQVELPLAMSVILTGIRVATVISVGVATIAAAVGAGGLGVYIFRGLRQSGDHNLLLAGAVPAALMALAADFLIGSLETRFSNGTSAGNASGALRRKLSLGLAVAILLLSVYGFWATGSSAPTAKNAELVRVASKDFTESILLSEIMAQLLEARGVNVERKFELGGTLAHDSLVSGTIDLYPEYTGTAYTAILHHQPITDPRAVYEQVKADYAARFNVEVGPPLGFENTFAILIRGADARRLRLKTISEAAAHTKQWRAGFGQDFMSRADGYPGFAKAYGLQFADQPHEMDLSLTYIALSSGKVDLIAGNSTEGRIGALDLVQLEDDRHYFPPYEAVYLVRKGALQNATLREALAKLQGVISTEEMRRLNYEVDARKRSQTEVVREWLLSKGL